MHFTFWIAAVLMFVVCFLSGAFPLYFPWKKNQLQYLLSFGAGVLLATAFLHMLPLTTDMLGKFASFYLLAGFLIMFFFERFIMIHPCGEADHCPQHPVGISAFLGLSLHTLATGMALGAGLGSAVDQGVLTAILFAILSHKVPECIALSSLLMASHWAKRRVLLFIFLYALVGPLGILLSSVSIDFMGSKLLGIAIAIAAGTFIYIASSDLLPQLHRKDPKVGMNLVFFCLGLLLFSIHALNE